MFIQLENQIAVNADRVFLVPASRNEDGEVLAYDVFTGEENRLCNITPREAEVFLHLASTDSIDRNRHPVLRTREWSVTEDGKLNYRVAFVFEEKARKAGYPSPEEYLKATMKTALASRDRIFETLESIKSLSKDEEYLLDDPARLNNILLSDKMNNASKLQAILDAFDEIFYDLPF